MQMKSHVLTIIFIFLLAMAAAAQTAKPAPDPRVKSALDSIGYKYTLNDSNDYKLTPIQTEQVGTVWRSQLVYVNSNTEKYGSLEIREVLSPVFLTDDPLQADIANRLLIDNNRVKLGAFRTVLINSGVNKGKCLVMFAAQIPANADAESLRLTIKSVILIADRTEKDITGKDDY